VTLRYFGKNRRRGFAKNASELFKSKGIRASTNRCTDEVDIFYRISKKRNTNIHKTKPQQCSSGLFVETDERVLQKTSKNFYKQGKYAWGNFLWLKLFFMVITFHFGQHLPWNGLMNFHAIWMGIPDRQKVTMGIRCILSSFQKRRINIMLVKSSSSLSFNTAN